MGMYAILEEWKAAEPWLDLQEITAVLHTSCVNYNEYDLKRLDEAGVRWCIPDNVRVELELLKDCPGAYGENAAFILRKAKEPDKYGKPGRPGRCVDGKTIWDLEQLYRGCTPKLPVEKICCGAMLFLFGDLAKQNEFLENAVDLPGHYVLVGTSWENCIAGPDNKICSLTENQKALRQAATGFWTGKRVRPVGHLARRNTLKELRWVWSTWGGSETNHQGLNAGQQFRKTDKGGSYGELYTTSAFENQVLKLYKEDKALRGNDIDKLNVLTCHGQDLKHLNLAMPEELLFWTNAAREDILVGYAMKPLRGKPISCYYDDGWKAIDDPNEVLRSIGRILVELHCRHILVNDLSGNNILVDADGTVGLVDCDSFQICGYPGGHMTDLYRHPQVRMDACNVRLRQPRYEYFAFAVLMYQCAMLCNPLLRCDADPDAAYNWEDRAFPLEWNTTRTNRVNEGVLKAWRGEDERTRVVFSNIFHFRRDYSIGALLRELELV